MRTRPLALDMSTSTAAKKLRTTAAAEALTSIAAQAVLHANAGETERAQEALNLAGWITANETSGGFSASEWDELTEDAARRHVIGESTQHVCEVYGNILYGRGEA